MPTMDVTDDGVEVLPNLRWAPKSPMQALSLKLQQAHRVMTYKGGEPVSVRIEWRDVPTVNSADDN